MLNNKAQLFLVPLGTGVLLLTIFIFGIRAGNPARAAEPDLKLRIDLPAPTQFQIEVSDPVVPVSTRNVRDLPMAEAWKPGDPVLEIPRFTRPSQTLPGRALAAGGTDPLLGIQAGAEATLSPAGFETPLLNFNGIGFTGANPPDTVGDVGPNHYIQMVNATGGAQFAIYNKAGSLLTGPTFLDSLGSGACSNGRGDPIVLYDPLADRWLLSEFDTSLSNLCVYVSQTPDPTAAFWSYTFITAEFPDYPKYAVWPDAYYISANQSSPAAFALDRSQMISGSPATYQRFTASSLAGFDFQALIPSDLDGAASPPAGSPNYFMRHRDDEAHNAGSNNPTLDFLEIWEFHVDFATPANSTFSLANTITTAEFDSDLCGLTSFNCFPQPGSTTTLDPLREVVMWRLQYRNFGTHETLVGNLVTDVNGSDHGGIRWFELRKSGAGSWALHQEGTYAPDSVNRWMGAIAMDGAGNIALGYNVTDGTSTYPSLRYAGRMASDPAGALPQGEYVVVNGSAANVSNRYGDYSAMSVDPVDDCTFWFTGEYNASSNWSTRIATFKFDGCGFPDFTISSDPTSQNVCSPTDAVYDIVIGQVEGFSDPVSLLTSGTPAGATSSFSVNPVSPLGTSILTLGTGGTTPGNYTFDVVGLAPTSTHTTTLGLNLFDAIPTAPTLLTPTDGAVDVSFTPTFTWSGAGTSYTIEIATDAAFTNIVDSASLTGTSYSGAALDLSTTYYWRVSAANVCGTSPTSAVWSFTTMAVPGECAPGTMATSLYQTGFESGEAGWTHSGIGDTWALSSANPHGGSTAFHADDVDSISDQQLVSPDVLLPIGENPITLQFWNEQDLESAGGGGCFDGGILEISTNGGSSWTQILDADLITDPYDGVLATGFGNPLAGLNAWCGDPQAYLNSIVDLNAFAGQTVRFRFRLGTDNSFSQAGWDLDDVNVQSCAPIGDILLSPDLALAGAQSTTLTYTLGVTNIGLVSDVVDLAINGNSWPTVLSENAITMDPGQTVTFTVAVTIPFLAPNGAIDVVTVFATPQGTGTISDAADLTTTVMGMEHFLFLPSTPRNWP